MPNPSVQMPNPRRSGLLPWVVLLVAVGLSVAAWWLTRREVRRTTEAQFERLTERVQSTLRRRFDGAALLLHGAAAFPEAAKTVTANEWSVYLRTVSSQLGEGLVGLGYAERVARADVDQVEARVRAEGLADFSVERAGAGDWLYVVLGIEPREHNTGVLGLNIGSGVTRKEAAERAAAENNLILSRRIRINYDQQEVPGFLLFYPVFKPGVPAATPAERLAAVQGWVYAAIRIDHLMGGVVDSVMQQIHFDVYEGDGIRPGSLLYDADGKVAPAPDRPTDHLASSEKYRVVQGMDLFGRHWTLALSPRPEFDQANFSALPNWVLGVGLVFSVLVSVLTWALVNSRGRALKLAGDMTVDLRRLALVASHTGSGVILTDPEWRVEWINRGFTRLFGYTLEEIRGRKPASFMMGPDTDTSIMETIDAATGKRQPFLGEILNYTKEGKKVWIELEIQPVLNDAGELEGFMGLQLDITERKRQAEQMREAMEAAEKANQAKSQFLAMMSHEIRTPMNGVIGMTSLLIDTPLNPEQRESAEIIRQSGESLLTIINDILDFSKIESGRLDLENTEFAVADCVEGAIDLLSAPAAKKNIELLYEIDDDLPSFVVGDAVRLRQVLVNLLGNAVKFTAEGEVALTVKVRARTEGSVDLVFSVRDSGIGISREGMDRLFKPFSQVDASMTRKFGGTGLGLVISRRLVELMGGRISAESELGHGSTFFFSLQLPVVADGAAVPPGAPSSLKNRRILVAVGNATARRIILQRLRNWGMEPVEAEAGDLALARLQTSEKFDAAIIDVRLPGKDVRVVAKEIRAMSDRAKLPLILLSAQGRRENADGLFASVLSKPVKPTQLFDAFVQTFWPSRGAAATAVVKSAPPMPPPEPALRVLFAAAQPGSHAEVAAQLTRANCAADVVASRAELIDAVRRRSYDVIFLDFSASSNDGIETAREIRRALPGTDETWLVALTATATPADKEAWRAAGIDDGLVQPHTEVQLSAAIERAKWRLPS